MLVKDRIHQYDLKHHRADPEATFVFLLDKEKPHYHVVIDFWFREGYGRTPHRKVLELLHGFKQFDSCEVIGGGVLRANRAGNFVASYHSEALGEIPALYHEMVRICLGLQEPWRD